MARNSLGDYYSFLAGDIAQQIVARAAKDIDTVKRYVAGFEAAADEVICFPASTDLEQVDRLADAVFG
jgi:hypothetical protein